MSRICSRVALLFVPMLAAPAGSQDVGSLVRVTLQDGSERRGVIESRKHGLMALRTGQGVSILHEDRVREVRNVQVPPAAPRRSPPPPPPPVSAEEIAAAVRALGDPRPEPRGDAEDFLHLHRVAARPALIEALRAAPQKDARCATARLLGGSIRDPAVRDALRQALTQDVDPTVRRIAAIGLRRQDPSGMRDVYLEALDHERDVAARKSLIVSLSALRDPIAIPGLIRLLEHEDEEYLRACLAQALQRLAGGPDFGEDARAWEEWWGRNQERLSRLPAQAAAGTGAGTR